jgi:hypothetical protein
LYAKNRLRPAATGLSAARRYDSSLRACMHARGGGMKTRVCWRVCTCVGAKRGAAGTPGRSMPATHPASAPAAISTHTETHTDTRTHAHTCARAPLLSRVKLGARGRDQPRLGHPEHGLAQHTRGLRGSACAACV